MKRIHSGATDNDGAGATLAAGKRCPGDKPPVLVYTEGVPTIYREGPYRFFFNSREETRMHVHIETSDGNAKFWLEPLVALVTYHNLRANDLSRIEQIVREHQDEFIAAWRRHFGV